MPEKLHEIISEVIRAAGKPLKVSDITKIIKDQGLWFRPSDKQSPKSDQISARINNYAHLFKRDNGFVELIGKDPERRLLRITYNKNLWEVPSGHQWSKKNQSMKDIAFENQFGFGGEEWLFNRRYNIDGFQYGYIRGLYEVTNIDFIDIAYLFSIDPVSKDRLLIAVLRNVELLNPETLSNKVLTVFKKHESDMIEELREVDADYRHIDLAELYPFARFKLEEATILDQPFLLNELKEGGKYNRFKPYKLDTDLEQLLSDAAKQRPTKFIWGKRKITLGGHVRKTATHTKVIASLHNQITVSLEKFLMPDYSLIKKNISIETMTFGNNIADFVLERPDKRLTIMEIKTSSNVRYNIREALGQLLDYCNWEPGLDIYELVIVSPSPLSSHMLGYFTRIKDSLKVRLSYWQYCGEKNGSEKFLKY